MYCILLCDKLSNVHMLIQKTYHSIAHKNYHSVWQYNYTVYVMLQVIGCMDYARAKVTKQHGMVHTMESGRQTTNMAPALKKP